MPCTPFSVDLEVVTPDQTKKVIFGLERTCNADNTESWTIHFELDEAPNAGAPFVEVVKLDIKVNPENNAAASAASQAGFTPSQSAQALAAGDTAKAFKRGEASADDVSDDANAVFSS
jgi:hypothetical protein